MPLYAPARPYAPVSKRVLLDEPGRRGVSPPPLSDLSLDAPVRPCTPLCQNAFCLTSPGTGACHPPPPLKNGLLISLIY